MEVSSKNILFSGRVCAPRRHCSKIVSTTRHSRTQFKTPHDDGQKNRSPTLLLHTPSTIGFNRNTASPIPNDTSIRPPPKSIFSLRAAPLVDLFRLVLNRRPLGVSVLVKNLRITHIYQKKEKNVYRTWTRCVFYSRRAISRRDKRSSAIDRVRNRLPESRAYGVVCTADDECARYGVETRRMHAWVRRNGSREDGREIVFAIRRDDKNAADSRRRDKRILSLYYIIDIIVIFCTYRYGARSATTTTYCISRRFWFSRARIFTPDIFIPPFYFISAFGGWASVVAYRTARPYVVCRSSCVPCCRFRATRAETDGANTRESEKHVVRALRIEVRFVVVVVVVCAGTGLASKTLRARRARAEIRFNITAEWKRL